VIVARASLFSRICTALLVAVGFAVVYAIAAVWLGQFFKGYFEKDPPADTREMLFIEPDGTVLIGGFDGQKPQYQYRSLDGRPAAPESARARIIGAFVSAHGDRPAQGLQDVNQDGWAGCVYPFADNALPPTYWYFVVVDDNVNGRGYFAGYNAQTRLSAGYLARDGFTSAKPARDAQFPVDGARFRYGGTLFGCLGYGQPQGLSPGGPAEPRSDCTYPPWIFYLHSGGRMLKIDLVGRTVGTALEADDILSIGQVFRTEPEGAYSHRNLQTLAVRHPERITHFNPIDESTEDWRIPAELRDEEFTFYRVSEQTAFVDVSHSSDPTRRNDHELVWFNKAGEITRREKVSLKGLQVTPNGLAATGPFLALPELLFWACVIPTMDADQPGGGSLPAFAAIWPGALFIFCTTAFAVVLTDRKQRRSGMPRSYAWLAFVLLLGMPGYVGFLVHRRWPRHAPIPPQQRSGIEVFA
jgi:hypothetical protein